MSARASRKQGRTSSSVAGESDEDKKRKERQRRAKDAEEEEKSQLAQHLREVDRRLLQDSLRKEAERRKRCADAWDPTPKVRPMVSSRRTCMCLPSGTRVSSLRHRRA